MGTNNGKNAAQRVAPGKTAFIKDVATSGNEKNGFHGEVAATRKLVFARWNAAIEQNHFYPSPFLHPPDCFQPDKERRRLLDMHLDNTVLILVFVIGHTPTRVSNRESRETILY